jgi:hypothetical protein
LSSTLESADLEKQAHRECIKDGKGKWPVGLRRIVRERADDAIKRLHYRHGCRLGGGVRLFDEMQKGTRLEKLAVKDGPYATHLHYRVAKTWSQFAGRLWTNALGWVPKSNQRD